MHAHHLRSQTPMTTRLREIERSSKHDHIMESDAGFPRSLKNSSVDGRSDTDSGYHSCRSTTSVRQNSLRSYTFTHPNSTPLSRPKSTSSHLPTPPYHYWRDQERTRREKRRDDDEMSPARASFESSKSLAEYYDALPTLLPVKRGVDHDSWSEADCDFLRSVLRDGGTPTEICGRGRTSASSMRERRRFLRSYTFTAEKPRRERNRRCEEEEKPTTAMKKLKSVWNLAKRKLLSFRTRVDVEPTA